MRIQILPIHFQPHNDISILPDCNEWKILNFIVRDAAVAVVVLNMVAVVVALEVRPSLSLFRSQPSFDGGRRCSFGGSERIAFRSGFRFVGHVVLVYVFSVFLLCLCLFLQHDLYRLQPQQRRVVNGAASIARATPAFATRIL